MYQYPKDWTFLSWVRVEKGVQFRELHLHARWCLMFNFSRFGQCCPPQRGAPFEYKHGTFDMEKKHLKYTQRHKQNLSDKLNCCV